MKRNTTFIFAGIMSAIVGNAYATGENTVTSKSYVDAQDALKQDLIDAAMLEITTPKGYTVTLPTLVSYDDVDHLTGTKYGVVSNESQYDVVLENESLSTSIPSMNFIHSELQNIYENIGLKQGEILRSGYVGTRYDPIAISSMTNGYLGTDITGTGLVTKTGTDGNVGERKIFEASDVSGYHGTNLTQYEKDVQDISIPTVGAMMSAISNGITAAAPTGTANTIANYDANGALGSGIATYDASGTYTAQTDAGKIATAAAVETRQKKKVCAGWPDGTTTYDAQHTDANCWLWTLPD